MLDVIGKRETVTATRVSSRGETNVPRLTSENFACQRVAGSRATISSPPSFSPPAPKTISSGRAEDENSRLLLPTTPVDPQKCRAHVAINFPRRTPPQNLLARCAPISASRHSFSPPRFGIGAAGRVALGQCRLPPRGLTVLPPFCPTTWPDLSRSIATRREETGKEGR